VKMNPYLRRQLDRLLDAIVGRIVRRGGDIVLGFGTTDVRPDHTCNINVQPQYRFRPRLLVIPSDVAPHFVVTSIKVSLIECLAGGSVPAEAFSPEVAEVSCSLGVFTLPSAGKRFLELSLPVAETGQYVTLSVTNVDPSHHHPFRAALVGSAC